MAKKDASRALVPRDVEGRMAILERAESGDNEVLPQLKAMFDDPELGLSAVFGDLAKSCEKALVAAASGRNLLFKEGLERRVRALSDELAGPRPTAIERLLAERAAFCWLALHKCEAEESRSRGVTLAQAEYQRRMIDSAHRRYLSSLKTLATVRKLALPSIQVNIGKNQVNVGGV